MHMVLLLAAATSAAAAAVLSTWSPCGRSMLSTLTPVGARSRGASYRATVAWFVTGAVGGGLCLGAAMAALAALVHATAPGPRVAGAVAAGAAALAAVLDVVLGPARIPGHHRQVNERWLDRYRPWVYGAGFGWQIGAGLATYVTTVLLYLLVALAALSASPVAALALGAGFGLVRGLAVLVGRHITGPDALLAFHRRFDRLEAPARHCAAGVTAALALILAVSAAGATVSAGGTLAAFAVLAVLAVAAVAARIRAGGRRRAGVGLG